MTRPVLARFVMPTISLAFACLGCGGSGSHVHASDDASDDASTDATAGDDSPFEAMGDDAAALGDTAPAGMDPMDDGPSAGDSSPDGGAGCDDSQGDLSACGAPDGATCLTPSLCTRVGQLVLPRSAGLAMDCIGGYGPGCDVLQQGDCLVWAAGQACHAADAGTPPCDTVATICQSGDPSGLVDECLGLASALEPTAVTGLDACLVDAGTCDPDLLTSCAANLFP